MVGNLPFQVNVVYKIPEAKIDIESIQTFAKRPSSFFCKNNVFLHFLSCKKVIKFIFNLNLSFFPRGRKSGFKVPAFSNQLNCFYRHSLISVAISCN